MNYYGCHQKKFSQAVGKLQRPLITAALALTLSLILLSGTSWADTHTAATCSSANVNTAISAASNGDTVAVPAGSCSWSSGLTVNKPITLQGNGVGSTIITSGPLIVNAAGVVVTGFTLYGNINVNAGNYRIYHNAFPAAGSSIEVSGASYGVIDNNTFTTTGTSSEIIHVYGPNDSWSTDSSIGDADNVFIEDNTFTGNGGSGQAVQGNYNGRLVFRYNTVNNMKLDMHGIWSNGSPSNYLNWTVYTDPGYISNSHSARHCEVYNNTFTNITLWAMELRGGTGVVYNNTITTSGDGILLRDYCTSIGADGNCARCMCPADYPLRDQIGRGKNQTSEPMYLWNNTVNGAAVVGYTGSWDQMPHCIVFEGQPSVACVAACGSGVGYSTTGAGDTMANLSAVIKENRDYYISFKPGYTSYTYPHPLRNGGSSVSAPKGLKVVGE